MRTRQKRVATDTWRSLGCQTTPLKHWSRRKPTVEPRWAKQQTRCAAPFLKTHSSTCPIIRAHGWESTKRNDNDYSIIKKNNAWKCNHCRIAIYTCTSVAQTRGYSNKFCKDLLKQVNHIVYVRFGVVFWCMFFVDFGNCGLFVSFPFVPLRFI